MIATTRAPSAGESVSTAGGAPRVGDRDRVLAAVEIARRVYPNPVGEWLARELFEWHGFGYRLGGWDRVARLIAHLEEKDTERAST